MARPQSRYVCQACGASTIRWEGRCPKCGAWETLVETLVSDQARSRARAATGAGSAGAVPVPLGDVEAAQLTRIPIGIGELDRVLGGGLVPGSLVLLGGEPGIGKSTLVLQAAAGLAPGRVLYASGEESANQLRLRAQRLGLLDGPVARTVDVLAETDVERIIEAAIAARPQLLVVDSIQTMSIDGLDGPAGSVGQVREATARLTAYARAEDVPIILVGHVTKDGTIAGPKTLEHLVDAVLTLEGERFGPLRLLRSTKNRFGSTDEIGVFEMASAGLREVADPARAFLSDATGGAPGVAVGATVGGTRPLLVEVQALVAPAASTPPRRTVSGLDTNRLALLIAVLGRRAGIGLGGHDVYASLPGGLSVADPGIDLPLAIALASSLRDRPVRRNTVACAEVGLLGELRPVTGLDRRLREAERLGFTRAVIGPDRDAATRPRALGAGPRDAGEAPGGGMEVVAVRTLREALEAALEPAGERAREDRIAHPAHAPA